METKVKFGLSQITQKTPDFAHWIPKFYILFSGSGLVMLTALGVSPDIESKIVKLAIAFSPAFILIGEMFGINLKQQTTTKANETVQPLDSGTGTGNNGGDTPPVPPVVG